MYLKLGELLICDSSSDGLTRSLSVPLSRLPKRIDSVHPLGSTNPAHFQRKGVSREIEITVLREFSSYRDAEVWTVEHMAEMERLSAGGDLEFESYLGVGYLYGTAALSNAEVVSASGVSVEIKYTFSAGRAITFYGVVVDIGGTEYLIEMDDGALPLVRAATR